MKIYLFILIINISLQYYPYDHELEKYGKGVLKSSDDYLYLDLSDYEEGDKIYLEVSCYSTYSFSSFSIEYYESYSTTPSSSSFHSMMYNDGYDYSYSSYHNNYYYTYKFKITLKYNARYLMIRSSYASSRYLYVEHIDYATLLWIIGVVIGVVAFIAIVYFISRYIKRIRYKQSSTIITQPQVTVNLTEPIYEAEPVQQNPPIYSTAPIQQNPPIYSNAPIQQNPAVYTSPQPYY